MLNNRKNLRNVLAIAICLVATTLFFSCKKSSEKQITAFSFATPQAVGVINEAAKTIAVAVPAGTDVTALSPSITVSDKATVSPASGVKQNFTNPVTYTVKAEDGSTVNYIVTVTVGTGGNNGGENEKDFVIEVTNVIGSSSGVVTVKALEWIFDDVIASAEYKNKGFKLTLPNTMQSKYLQYDVSEYFDVLPSMVSDKNAKVSEVYLLAYNNAGDVIGGFDMSDEGMDFYVFATYYYADRDFTIKGIDNSEDYDVEWNCTFKKGWNIMYWYEDDGWDELYTTQKPSGINLQWYFLNFEKSLSQKSLKQKKMGLKKVR